MTDASQYFTVSDVPDRNGWLAVEIHDGRKMSGRAWVHTRWEPAAPRKYAPARHALILDLGRHLQDENGRTVYRSADPAADEVSTSATNDPNSAIIARPVRVNGIAYTGTVYLERDYNDDGSTGRWHSTHSSIQRVDDYFGNVTDAARSRVYNLALDLAAELATDERIKWDRVRAAESAVDHAQRDLDKAQAAVKAATDALAEAVRDYETLAASSS